MAKKAIVELIDDVDGTGGDDIETIEFGLDGVTYTIDLNERNADRLRSRLADYIEAGRRVNRRSMRATSNSGPVRDSRRGRERARAIREWARKHGFEVSDRGRIPVSVVAEFEAATARRR